MIKQNTNVLFAGMKAHRLLWPEAINESDRIFIATKNISDLESLFAANDLVEIKLVDGYIYLSTLITSSAPVNAGDGIFEVTYTFDAIRRLPLETINIDINLNLQSKVFCKSNIETDCIISGYTNYGYSIFMIMGISVAFSPSNTSPAIINGIDKTVTAYGYNIFGSVNMINFPKLKPGVNSIPYSAGLREGYISYYPTFV